MTSTRAPRHGMGSVTKYKFTKSVYWLNSKSKLLLYEQGSGYECPLPLRVKHPYIAIRFIPE